MMAGLLGITRPSSRSVKETSELLEAIVANMSTTTRPPSCRSNQSNRSSSQSTSSRASSRTTSVCGASVACDLRQFSQARGRIGILPHETTSVHPPLSMDELLSDVAGRNGHWKQKRATEELERRNEFQARMGLEILLEKQLLQHQKDEEREWRRKVRALSAVSAWSRLSSQCLVQDQTHQRVMEDRRQEEERKADDERQMRSRLPRTCGDCGGTGCCVACRGIGYGHAVYLSANAGPRSTLFHGKTTYGCTACGGVRDGGDVWGSEASTRGDGHCTNCGGLGKVLPAQMELNEVAEEASTTFVTNFGLD